MGLADEHEVGAFHLSGAQPNGRRRGHAVHVGIEKDDGLAEGEAVGGTAQPIEGDIHGSGTSAGIVRENGRMGEWENGRGGEGRAGEMGEEADGRTGEEASG